MRLTCESFATCTLFVLVPFDRHTHTHLRVRPWLKSISVCLVSCWLYTENHGEGTEDHREPQLYFSVYLRAPPWHSVYSCIFFDCCAIRNSYLQSPNYSTELRACSPQATIEGFTPYWNYHPFIGINIHRPHQPSATVDQFN